MFIILRDSNAFAELPTTCMAKDKMLINGLSENMLEPLDIKIAA